MKATTKTTKLTGTAAAIADAESAARALASKNKSESVAQLDYEDGSQLLIRCRDGEATVFETIDPPVPDPTVEQPAPASSDALPLAEEALASYPR